jgi:hypothetical protein
VLWRFCILPQSFTDGRPSSNTYMDIIYIYIYIYILCFLLIFCSTAHSDAPTQHKKIAKHEATSYNKAGAHATKTYKQGPPICNKAGAQARNTCEQRRLPTARLGHRQGKHTNSDAPTWDNAGRTDRKTSTPGRSSLGQDWARPPGHSNPQSDPQSHTIGIDINP